ncbi:beta family protein [Vibrio parahaemolyticus]|uniref:beta family protein n=1 Tax=Vibrio parahaemolyticus TaxID=670 RepID=UPI002269C9EC|nr:protein beta [Vibrio parahaemolyticus]MCX8811003.1 beta family protein [Vibrio parahaemolyticus]MCX8835974.1 beta family protein [Vibrio parahaemolyticus]MCX8907996.1 beta family protein [Vibrio parahaemolyticus]HCE2830854.1 protein beta [Vibrio parahaemolyticus]HCH0818473.1 protein beta [Vibrio parahaemolyticus]
MFDSQFAYQYCPILAISPSELQGLKELPDKDKNLILPIFPLKSWAAAKELKSSIAKVEESIGKNRKWIADIDYVDLLDRKKETYRPVHHDLLKLIDPADGYRNWCDFIKEHINTIPCLQLKDLQEITTQIKVLSGLGRGIVVILKQTDLESQRYQTILSNLTDVNDLFVILDLEQITKEQVDLSHQVLLYLNAIKTILPQAMVSLSSTSFPDSFGGYYKGVKSIYERALFDKIKSSITDLIYSDRGSARATKMSGGAGVPPPRIDYACRNEWNFIRLEFTELSDSLTKSEKQAQIRKEKMELYTLISKQIMREPYWEGDLALWANYIIELTSKGDEYGINSAQKATAVRINKHLYTQLHYDSLDVIGDTDDDWED